MQLLRLGLILLTFALDAGSASFAQAPKRRASPAAEPVPYSSQAVPPRCEPLCSADTSPCDPPIMKHADGRCSNMMPTW